MWLFFLRKTTTKWYYFSSSKIISILNIKTRFQIEILTIATHIVSTRIVCYFQITDFHCIQIFFLWCMREKTFTGITINDERLLEEFLFHVLLPHRINKTWKPLFFLLLSFYIYRWCLHVHKQVNMHKNPFMLKFHLIFEVINNAGNLIYSLSLTLFFT